MSTERFRLVLVSAGTSDPSSTRLLADRTADRVKALAARRGHEVTVGVIRVGETSCTFAFSTVVVGGEPDDPAAPREVSSEGRVVVVHAPDPSGGAQPWPDDVRSLLESDRALVST